MTRMRDIKTNFTAGEVSPDILGRSDLRAYENGALALRNVFIKPTGGVTRRAGLNYIDTARGSGRLIPFEFNTAQTYLLVVTHGKIDIYAGGLLDETVDAPWSAAQIPQLAWTQSADTLLLVHPDISPRKLTRNADGSWTLAGWEFFGDGNVHRQPYFKFAPTSVTLDPSANSGNITITASAPVFKAGHENTRLRIVGKEVLIFAPSRSRHGRCMTRKGLCARSPLSGMRFLCWWSVAALILSRFWRMDFVWTPPLRGRA